MITTTLLIKIGRRCPKSWAKRQVQKISGLLSFQENLWIIISSSISLAKRKANADGRVKFVVTKKTESEDLHYQIEWIEIVIQGSEEAEADEFKDMQNFYLPLSKVMKKDMPKDESFARHFKTKVLSLESMEKAYREGYGAIDNQTLANKVLEMGILTHMEWIKDFETREIPLPIDN